MDWYYDIEVSTFGSEWALVLFYGGTEYREEAAFPTIVGFAARRDFPWSVATVLAHDIHGTFDPTIVESSGWSELDQALSMFCWTRDSDERGWGRYLLKLDREEIRAFADACAGLRYEAILERVINARNDLDEWGDSNDESTRVGPARDVFHRLAEVINMVDREDELENRISHRVAWLAKIGANHAILDERRAADELEGMSPADTREILLQRCGTRSQLRVGRWL